MATTSHPQNSISLEKLSMASMPRSDSGNSSESCHSETDCEVENLVNTNDSGIQEICVSPLSKTSSSASTRSSISLSSSKKRPLQDITNDSCNVEQFNSQISIEKHSDSAINLDQPSSPKAPRFDAESPSWISTNDDIVPNFQQNSVIQNDVQKPEITSKTHQTSQKNLIKPVQTPKQKILKLHPDITPKMRAMLCDWMIEVCEVHTMHRQTYYLAISYLDTYLLKTKTPLDRCQLQLLGITCLFIAAKLEEIHPAKVEDLAFLTDGACDVQDMLSFEMIILNVLKWKLHPTTLLDWLALYLQHAYHPQSETLDLLIPTEQHRKRPLGDIIHKHFPDDILVQMMQLCDIITLDLASLNYKQEELAAAVLYHFSASNIVEKATGYVVSKIKPGILHVTKFALAVKSNGFETGKKFDKVQDNDWVNIQTHYDQMQVVETIPGIFEEDNL